MSYTTKIKNEAATVDITTSEIVAELSGFIRNNMVIRENNITLSSENKTIIDRMNKYIEDIFKITPKIEIRNSTNFSKRDLYFLLIPYNKDILTTVGYSENEVYLDNPPEYIVGGNEEIRAYLRGVFFHSGSINDPKTSRYHMEILVLEPEEVTVVPDIKYEGIAGLVCAKMCENLQVPTIVFSDNGDLCRGSARAPLGYKLLDLISEMKEILPDAIVSAGGHARAAGIAIKSKYLERFKLEWANLVRSTEREEFTDFKEPIDLDKYIATGELTAKVLEYGLEDIDELYPFNKTIQEPTFKAHVNLDEQRFVRMKERHLKVFLSKDVNVIVWNYAKRPTVTEFDVSGALKENDYGGITYQLETFF